ncbi:hypothetical protein NCCP2140_01040 [Pseudoalteromonas sp. NCCP-2140]|uniref:retron Ec48 family effector membrane protein n=1 Tax=Pseudoalteromonas sp. NCCP-2140 TaxID=2942288 RepID=UPI0020414565|nr:retron Ec48 family effector membrane protein [Pseudoalteromonas sp. NCCP-2140]GKW51051.1 hypothetical protein NCCP2140_01040 [Pseudoalteromonas sp. NCCP-2140]
MLVKSKITKLACIYAFINFIFLVLLLVQMNGAGTFSLDFCIQDRCLKYIYDRHQYFIELVIVINKFLAGLTAIFGVAYGYVAFIEQSKDRAFNNHLRNLEFFVSFIKSEIDRLDYLSQSSVDFNILYQLIYPNSSEGKMSNFDEYKRRVKELRDYVISYSNGYKGGIKKMPNSEVSFFNHKKKIIKLAKKFGIDVANLPKGDFFSVESDFFKLLDVITTTFTNEREVQRARFLMQKVDIHYR